MKKLMILLSLTFLLIQMKQLRVSENQNVEKVEKISERNLLENQNQQFLVLTIKDTIDLSMARYVALGLKYAEQNKCAGIIIDMDTYGGLLVAADEIRKGILNLSIPSYVLINSNAISAGALIAIACDKIYMVAGGSIGAATVVNEKEKVAPEKYQSFMKALMRATAETKKRNPQIAEAMVSISNQKAKEVVTLSTQEAIKKNFCTAEVSSIDELCQHQKIPEYKIEHFQVGFVETIILFFLKPFVKSILILIITLGFYATFQSMQIGFPLFYMLSAILLYFVPFYLQGFISYLEIILLFAGIILLLLELFITPGFMLSGFLGAISIITSLALAMLHNKNFNFTFVSLEDILNAFSSIFLIAILGMILFLFFNQYVLSRSLPSIALLNTQRTSEGYVSIQSYPDLLGKQGKSITPLKPSGKVMVEGGLYNVQTSGEFISQDSLIEVCDITGMQILVKQVRIENVNVENL